LHQHLEYKTSQDGKSQELSKIILEINVPPDFPTKYYNTLENVAEQCAVKRTIMNPPQFEIKTLIRE
jgi:putative redox protein